MCRIIYYSYIFAILEIVQLISLNTGQAQLLDHLRKLCIHLPLCICYALMRSWKFKSMMWNSGGIWGMVILASYWHYHSERRVSLAVRCITVSSCREANWLGNFLEIQPFHLYMFPKEMEHICPVRALAAYIQCTRITSGYLFRKIDIRERSIIYKNEPMISKQYFNRS